MISKEIQKGENEDHDEREGHAKNCRFPDESCKCFAFKLTGHGVLREQHSRYGSLGRELNQKRHKSSPQLATF
jgi:hypothetical protein